MLPSLQSPPRNSPRRHTTHVPCPQQQPGGTRRPRQRSRFLSRLPQPRTTNQPHTKQTPPWPPIAVALFRQLAAWPLYRRDRLCLLPVRALGRLRGGQLTTNDGGYDAPWTGSSVKPLLARATSAMAAASHPLRVCLWRCRHDWLWRRWLPRRSPVSAIATAVPLWHRQAHLR